MIDYLTAAEVMAMHADQIARYSGSHGVTDKGCWLLEAALYRPQTGYYADLIEEAGALWESLAPNRPFIDGNKRTAFAATYTFLAVNGVRLTADARETYVFIPALYEANQFSFDKLVPWLRSHVTQDPPAARPGECNRAMTRARKRSTARWRLMTGRWPSPQTTSKRSTTKGNVVQS